MKILALDSSGLVASVAVAEEETVIAEYTINYKKTHSQTLLPMLNEIKKITELDLSTIDAIAVAAGPGSFTGLRIGSATAKGLGLVLEKPLVAVPTVDALAYQVYGCTDVICPIMDARRNQVYTGIYEFVITEFGNYDFHILEKQCALAIEELAEKLNTLERNVIFLGDGVPVYREMLTSLMKVPYHFTPAFMNRQRAASVAALGIQYYKEGKTQSAASHAPVYLRLTQAERERKEKGLPI